MLISFMLIEKRIYGPLGYKIIFEKFEKPSGPHATYLMYISLLILWCGQMFEVVGCFQKWSFLSLQN